MAKTILSPRVNSLLKYYSNMVGYYTRNFYYLSLKESSDFISIFFVALQKKHTFLVSVGKYMAMEMYSLATVKTLHRGMALKTIAYSLEVIG